MKIELPYDASLPLLSISYHKSYPVHKSKGFWSTKSALRDECII